MWKNVMCSMTVSANCYSIVIPLIQGHAVPADPVLRQLVRDETIRVHGRHVRVTRPATLRDLLARRLSQKLGAVIEGAGVAVAIRVGRLKGHLV